MSNPTSNFGWQMPTPTDLVTDLPADFEVFGQAVDTSLADLRGGTTGQILSKTTNADMDFTWTSASPGDITGVTAGTGISGGGTSGDVTVTNSMATAIDAKGDLIVGTGADTFSRLAAGTNTYILTADSAEATGLKWAAPAAGGFVGASVTKNGSAQSINNATYTAVLYQTENYDTDAFHDTSTNTSRMTIPAGKAGKYLVTATVTWAANGTGDRRIGIFKNGSVIVYGFGLTPVSVDETRGTVSGVFNLAVSDYIEIFAFQNSGGGLNVVGPADNNLFTISYLGA